jgi:hypothetical protein
MYLDLMFVDYIILVCKCYPLVLHLLLKLLYLLLYVLDLHVLRNLELLKLTCPNLGGLLGRQQKNTVPK